MTAISATGPSEPWWGATTTWCASAIAASFFLCHSPPKRPVSGCATSMMPRSISGRSANASGYASPIAIGTSTACATLAKPSMSTAETGSS